MERTRHEMAGTTTTQTFDGMSSKARFRVYVNLIRPDQVMVQSNDRRFIKDLQRVVCKPKQPVKEAEEETPMETNDSGPRMSSSPLYPIERALSSWHNLTAKAATICHLFSSNCCEAQHNQHDVLITDTCANLIEAGLALNRFPVWMLPAGLTDEVLTICTAACDKLISLARCPDTAAKSARCANRLLCSIEKTQCSP